MKKASLLILLILCISCSNDKKSETSNVDLMSIQVDANKFLDSQWNWFEESSLEMAKKMFYEKGILIGTDSSEFYTSWEELEPDIKSQLAIPNVTVTTSDRTIFISEGGDMVSFSEILDLSFQMGEEIQTINGIRSSGAIKKMKGQWRIIQMHNSIGLDGQAVNY
ncbi:nuclear transport factor 2 family protein [Flavobacteriaceae bacterium]|nr:nuclear transport factor 2 family protein [Flavobacteriaceae bacterium]